MSNAQIQTGSSGMARVWRRVAPWAIAISVVAAGLSMVGVRALESWRRGRDVKAAGGNPVSVQLFAWNNDALTRMALGIS